jgi:hypothetical protein
VYKLIKPEDIDAIKKGNDNLAAEFGVLLDIIIAAVGECFAKYCGRPDFDKAARTEYLNPLRNAHFAFIASPPISSSPVVDLWQSTDLPRVYGNDQKLVNGTDYFVHEAEGMLEHVSGFAGGSKSLKVTYTGGYLTADATGCPDALKLAAMIQTEIIFERRAEFGLTGTSLEGSSMSLLSPLTLPKSVTMLLGSYILMKV